MEPSNFLDFVCPHCAKPLSRFIDQDVLRAHIEYVCAGQTGGCGKRFEILYRRGETLITKPGQPLHARARIAGG